MDDLPGYVRGVPELLKGFGYAGQVVRAYQWAREERLRLFLRGLDCAASELSPDDRTSFEYYINSEVGTKVLAEFADTVVRTRSERVFAAFAILYADTNDRLYSLDFKAAAALALEGLAERSIDGFLLLIANQGNIKHNFTGDRTYGAYHLSSGQQGLPDALKAWSASGPEWVAIVHDLTTRGLLLPDMVGDPRWGGGDQLWRCSFSVSKDSKAYAALLTKARTFLRGRGALPSPLAER